MSSEREHSLQFFQMKTFHGDEALLRLTFGANTCNFTATGPFAMVLGAQKHNSNELNRFRTKLE